MQQWSFQGQELCRLGIINFGFLRKQDFNPSVLTPLSLGRAWARLSLMDTAKSVPFNHRLHLWQTPSPALLRTLDSRTSPAASTLQLHRLPFDQEPQSTTTMSSYKIPIPPHPFYPPEINLAGYLANDWNVPTLLAYFALGCVGILGTTHLVAGQVNPKLSRADRGLVLWFVLCKSTLLGWEEMERMDSDKGGGENMARTHENK